MPQILGKTVILTSDDPPSSYAELHLRLSKLNARDALRRLGEISSTFDLGAPDFVRVGETVVPNFALPFIAMELIIASGDDRVELLDDQTLLDIVKCYHALPWPDPVGNESTEMLLRMSQSQFSFQGNDSDRFARCLRVFHELWPLVPQAAGLDVDSALRDSLGFGPDELMAAALYMTSEATKGFTRLEPIDDDPNLPIVRLLTVERLNKLFARLSLTYSQMRDEASQVDVPDELRKSRYNPLVIRPMIVPDRQPEGDVGAPIFLVPCRKFLLDRLTYGVVMELKSAFGRRFDEAFGHVIEAYVGDTLKSVYGSAVLGEFEYKLDGNQFRAPDWTVFGSDAAVIFEVKHRLLYAQAKTFGELDAVRADLKRTLTKAIFQLCRFKEHLPRLRQPYPDPCNVELVVVAWDDVSWTAILRELVDDIPAGVHIHVAQVQQVEALLRRCATPDELYRILWLKRNAGREQADMDLDDWIATHLQGQDFPRVATLDAAYNAFLSRWGFRSSDRAGQLTNAGDEQAHR